VGLQEEETGDPGLLQLVAYQPFGPRRGVAAVRVGREVLVLGVTNTDLKLLRVLDAAAIEEGPPGPSPTGCRGCGRSKRASMDNA